MAGAHDVEMRVDRFSNGAGWDLAAKRVVSPAHFRPELRPLAIVPGYGMNAFIFGYHPSGPSMEEYFARAGFEVWSLTLRGQEGTRRRGGATRFGMAEIAVTDLRAALRHVAERTESRADGRVDSIGCSLGGTYQYIHAACVPDNRMGSIVAVGAPLAWHDVHPLLRALFAHPRVAGSIPFAFTRELAGLAFPLLLRIPRVLHLYMHPAITDVTKIRTLLLTVENPIARVNAEIAHWIRQRDLVIAGRNVTEAMAAVTNPLLVVVANADGIVPRETVLSAVHACGGAPRDVLEVGSDEVPMAHADLFVSNRAHDDVFAPVARWLEARNVERRAREHATRRGADRRARPTPGRRSTDGATTAARGRVRRR